MATLMLTSIGTAVAGPIGGALGGLVGQSLDQGLFGSRRRGPRLGDLSVQSSSYGSPIPRIYGSMRVAGSVIWATDLKEEEIVEGGGKSGPERQSYNYSVSLAVAISSRPVRMVRRIWADGKLIRGEDGDFKVRTKFRLRNGSEDQPVDPLIASVETIARTPAYRGLALAVFEDLELAEFGNRIPLLTFEVEADETSLPVSTIMQDGSGGLIQASDPRPIEGYAAHGTSIRDGLASLVEACGTIVSEKGDFLVTSLPTVLPLIAESEAGCTFDGQPVPPFERGQAGLRPSAVTIGYYDPSRDYQAGQMRAAMGGRKLDERFELPAVLHAEQAKVLAEAALARRGHAADRLTLRLPPSRMAVQPGNFLQLAWSARVWMARSVLIEGMAVVIEAEPAPNEILPLPADAGRSVSEPDRAVGRSELMLFELPAEGVALAPAPRVYAAAANSGLWRRLPVELCLGGEPLPAIAIPRRAVIGRAETVLDDRCPGVLDERSSVVVRLANSAQLLLAADADALMSGANLAVLGEELIQFGVAAQLGPGLFRLSRLLRGRRGTEWAAPGHSEGEQFCLIQPTALRAIEPGGGAVGAALRATAHGIADSAPLPMVERVVRGEAMRPPPPCHLRVRRSGASMTASWVRRSHAGWTWTDGVGVPTDPFPELYRLTATGPLGELTLETGLASHDFEMSQLPGTSGQEVKIEVRAIGSAAVSHAATTSIIL